MRNMIRMRRFLIVSILLVFVQLLTACDGLKDLFKQEQDPVSLVEENQVTNSPERMQPDKEGKDTTNGSSQGEVDRVIDQNSQGDTMETLGSNELQLFFHEEINDTIKARIVGKSYGEGCDIPFEELRYVSVLHWGFDGRTHTGELIVNKAIADDIVEIFQELYEQKYLIERMVLIDEYDADDNLSMEANNSSAFNYRVIDNGSGRLSQHSYGLAIDINPLYNPYVRTVNGNTVISPDNGEKYEDRTLDCAYYIDTEDPCYKAFTQRGFIWGGDWKNSKDYQHFQKESQ